MTFEEELVPLVLGVSRCHVLNVEYDLLFSVGGDVVYHLYDPVPAVFANPCQQWPALAGDIDVRPSMDHDIDVDFRLEKIQTRHIPFC